MIRKEISSPVFPPCFMVCVMSEYAVYKDEGVLEDCCGSLGFAMRSEQHKEEEEEGEGKCVSILLPGALGVLNG